MGFCTVGTVTFESAAYCARYMMKKVKGKDAEEHYTRIDPDTGEIFQVLPEYATMSRRPGIGKGWFDKYKDETYKHDSVIIDGKEVRPPKFYDSQLEAEHLEHIKFRRIARAKKHADDQTIARLRVREEVKEAQISNLDRGL